MSKIAGSRISPRWTFVLALSLVLLAAFSLRVWNIGWSLPAIGEEAVPARVAIQMWGFESGQPSLDPETAGWPALSFYVQRTLQQVHFLAGGFEDPLDYYVAWRLDPSTVILLGRWTSLICLLGVTMIALWMGRRLAGITGAFIAGLLCAASPLLLRHSQRVEPDSLLTLFSALALVWLFRIARRGTLQDYLWCGVWIGLGAASKYTPALIALGLWAVHVDLLRAEGRSLRFAGLDDRRPWLAAAAALAAFLVTNPYFFRDLAVLQRDFAYQAEHMSAGHFGHEDHGPGYARYLLHVLPRGLGWAGFLAGVWGIAAGLGDRTGARVLLWYTLPWVAVLGAFSTSFDRYMLPVLLPLALGAAMLVARMGRPRIAVLVGGLLLIQPVATSLGYQRLQSDASTRDLAGQWVRENIDRLSATIAMEFHGPDLVIEEAAQVSAEPVFARLSTEQQARLLARESWKAVRIPMYSVRAEFAAYYYDLRHYLAYDWLITSGGVARRYRANPEQFPEQIAFYDLLDELAGPAWSVEPGARRRGPRIQIWRMDDALRARITERMGELTPEHFRAWTDRVHPPHFRDFLLTVAGHAESGANWEQAALYYGTVAGAAGSTELRALGLEKCGASLFNAGDLDGAARWFEELSKYPEQRLVALGNLGLIDERRGDYQAARIRYEYVIAEDPGGEAAQWAQNRLNALPE